jgi:two-component system OmpR family sensor kinase
MKISIASRLSALYATLLGITVIMVILASSIALVVELTRFSGDIVMAKHEEARILAAQYRADGMTLRQSAPEIANALGGIGLRVSVYDDAGHFLGGDKSLHPKVLSRLVTSARGGPPPFLGPPNRGLGRPIELPSKPRPGHDEFFTFRQGHGDNAPHVAPPPPQFLAITPVEGGYVAFAPSLPLLLVSLVPYWRVVITLAIGAILISWLVGRLFAQQALRPISDVTGSLRALAEGDFTQRRFVAPGGDEIGELTTAFNEAAASVANAISERRLTEERMRQFVADAGHELRTPLTVIGGYIDVLRRGAVSEQTIARQILGTMAIEKEHMRGLIDRLMRLARLDSETPPHTEQIDLAQLFREQCEAARRLDETRNVDYSVDGVESVVADRAELGEAIWNVVENAIKYAPDAPIHLRADRSDGHAVITISDEGPGMNESERIHAFERFFRGERRGEISGSGLGLAIAKRAVERAGGAITLESAPNRGTTVTITLASAPQ